MVFWGCVSLALLALLAAGWWVDRKRRGAPFGSRDAQFDSTAAMALEQSVRHNMPNGGLTGG